MMQNRFRTLTLETRQMPARPPGSPKVDLSKNRILAALPEEESSRLRPHLQLVSCSLGKVLWMRGDPVRYLYFPQDAVAALLASMDDGKSVEVALTGAEGLLGIWALLGAEKYWYLAVVQVPGSFLRIHAEVLRAEFERGGVLHHQLLRYTRYLLAQISQTAACNRVHLLQQRLARWLLMLQDHAKGNEFPITHEFLSQMLGTPRSEVTLAAGMLRNLGLIRYARGKMAILDRQGLEAAACECYQIVTDELNDPPVEKRCAAMPSQARKPAEE